MRIPTTICLFLALSLAAGCGKRGPDPDSAVRTAGARTYSSFDPPVPGEKVTPAKGIQFAEADLTQVLNLYAEVSGRSIIRGPNIPDVKVTFFNQTPMTAVEVLQALDTVLAAQGIAMVYLGTQYAKVVQAKDAHLEASPVVELRPDQLPDSGSFVVYIVKLRKVTTSQAAPALQPFARLPNSIVAIGPGSSNRSAPASTLPNLPALLGRKDEAILILRDYSSNVRRMLQVLEKMEQQ